MVVGIATGFDVDFLRSHETQVIHGRGYSGLNDLWVDRLCLLNNRSPCSSSDGDPTSTQNKVILVENGGLAGRNGALRCMELNVSFTIVRRNNRRAGP